MGKTVTLKGPAAGAFMRAKMGERATTDDERALRVATMIYAEMQSGAAGVERAKMMIALVARDGLEKVADALTQPGGG